VLVDNSIRYDRVADLDPLLVSDEYSAEAALVQVGMIKLDINAKPSSRIETLIINDDAFAATWERGRKDLADQSPSSYDMSITNILVMGGFDDQEIADTIIAFRRKHNLDLQKAMRRDYIQRTIGRSRADYMKNQAAVELANSIPDTGKPADTGDPVYKEQREKCLTHIGSLFGIKVASITQYGREDARYRMTLSDGRDFPIGNVNTLTNQRLFINRMLQETGIRPGLTQKQWGALIKSMLFIMDVSEDDSIRMKSRMIEWMIGYRAGACEVMEVSGQDEPFLHKNSFYLRWENFKQYLTFVRFVRDITDSEIKENLKVIGFKRKSINIAISDQWTTKSYYMIDVKQLDVILASVSIEDNSTEGGDVCDRKTSTL
jgi:hypothetical protein